MPSQVSCLMDRVLVALHPTKFEPTVLERGESKQMYSNKLLFVWLLHQLLKPHKEIQ